MELKQDETRLWYVRVSEVDRLFLIHILEDLITPEERARHGRLKRPEDQRRFLATRWLERAGLSRVTGVPMGAWRFMYNAKGRPEIDHPRGIDLRYSLSHSGDLVVIGLTRASGIGVDVQRMESLDDLSQTGRVFCSPQEMQQLENQVTDERGRDLFFKIWTIKESYLKATGFGLSVPPTRCHVTRVGEGISRVEVSGESGAFGESGVSGESGGGEDALMFSERWLIYDWRVERDYHAAVGLPDSSFKAPYHLERFAGD